jgi:hypothetical protein
MCTARRGWLTTNSDKASAGITTSDIHLLTAFFQNPTSSLRLVGPHVLTFAARHFCRHSLIDSRSLAPPRRQRNHR